ncbi:MAG: zinc ribbon domain-containing protein [Eubacteriaceae bacterium]|nr:zinc ribbon domain-containing protein [Eubacteriaceae bacterium]
MAEAGATSQEMKKRAFCMQCGTPLSDGTNFCGKCGAKVQ